MRKILEPECGGSNPLTRLPSQIKSDSNRFTPFQPNQSGNSNLDARIAPTTFDVHSLLSEVRHMDSSAAFQNSMARWLPFFYTYDCRILAGPSVVELAGQAWSCEFSKGQPDGQRGHAALLNSVQSTNNAINVMPHRPMRMQHIMPNMPLNIPTASEILSKIDLIQEENEIATEEIDEVSPLVDQWTEEFMQGSSKESNEDMWSRLQKQWENLEQEDGDSYQNWLNDLDKAEDYTFQEDNDQLHNVESFQQGLQAMQRGDTSLAIKLFESVVRSDPQHVEGWYNLGNAQSSNEHDVAAISALVKCLEIDKTHMNALLAISVSYTNDHQFKKAITSLKSWLQFNERYSHLVNMELPADDDIYNYYGAKSALQDAVCKMFLEAARLSPTEDIDVDVQIGLGILFTISNDYGKAIDCFGAAVAKNPMDAMSWNKLGATYANNGANEKAISAYKRALQLRPGYVRTRYNLAIACTNLGAYSEALGQLVSVLKLRDEHTNANTTTTPASTESIATDTIWNTLKMNLSLLRRDELLKLADSRDLTAIGVALGL